jgi:hypothetical protein
MTQPPFVPAQTGTQLWMQMPRGLLSIPAFAGMKGESYSPG